ncbi:MAG: hypothetical protein KatS3mg102_2434 [Planctomycetota bacterium]|nr:MAG: hypothetical protein KatS3mg102_2434 [Planctomycetota bacterium]
MRHHPVALFAFRGPEVLAHSAPVRGAGARARLLALLAGLRPRGGGGPPAALAQLVRHRRRRGLAVVLTDALWPGDPAAPLGRLMAGGLEPVVLLVDEGGGGARLPPRCKAGRRCCCATPRRESSWHCRRIRSCSPPMRGRSPNTTLHSPPPVRGAGSRSCAPARASRWGRLLRELLRAGALD